MAESSDNELGPITVSAGDVRGLRALLRIANDRSCAPATRELARLGPGYLSTILGEPSVIEGGGACEQPDSTSGGELDGLGGGNPA